VAKNTKSGKSTNQLLIEQIMTKVATISQNIEKRGQSIFGQGNLLTLDEINDYSLEFL
jgi:rsbT co-antagonist protein RsbR